MNDIVITTYNPPKSFVLPNMTLMAYQGKLIGLDWGVDKLQTLIGCAKAAAIQKPKDGLDKNKASEWVLMQTIGQLDAYFAGQRQVFELPMAFNPFGNATPFQITVWQALCQIPYGQTISYATLAKQIGKPTAYRACANANGKNPISLIVPCHRVIASDGGIGGYTGGVGIKEQLLRHESLNS